jgi:hypothetical protein
VTPTVGVVRAAVGLTVSDDPHGLAHVVGPDRRAVDARRTHAFQDAGLPSPRALQQALLAS